MRYIGGMYVVSHDINVNFRLSITSVWAANSLTIAAAANLVVLHK